MTSENPSKEFSAIHTEKLEEDQSQRRRSSINEIAHSEIPVWEIRRTYTKQGMADFYDTYFPDV